MLIISTGCASGIQKCPDKPESIEFTYGKDSIKISFLVDSSIEKIHEVITWGYLNRFGYKSNESEIYFSFFSKDLPRISQLPDSTVVQNLKNKFKDMENGGKITKIEKIVKIQLYGFLVEYQRSKDRISMFSGEFTESHLPFSIEISQSNMEQPNPDILNCIVQSLEINIVPQ